MNNKIIAEGIKYIGVDDRDIDLFESQYVVENGMSYNSYIIEDEKICVMDCVNNRKVDDWLRNLDDALGGRQPHYLVVLHMEPDHSGGIRRFVEKYPEAKLVGNAKTFQMMGQFFDFDVDSRKHVVKEGDTLSLGQHILRFVFAPMVHWPEVMVAYECSTKTLFSADAFGKFGALNDNDEDWACEARRYYFNIVGKYGLQVQTLLKKAAALDIACICPLHGPILQYDLDYYLNLYDTWSSYKPEDEGVFIAVASIHGNTLHAAEVLKGMLEEKGVEKVSLADLSRADIAECVEDAFRYDRMVLCAASYDGGVFTPMDDFLTRLKKKGYRNRRVALVENGSWAPVAAKVMRDALDTMKNITVCENVVTVKSAYKPAINGAVMNALAEELAK